MASIQPQIKTREPDAIKLAIGRVSVRTLRNQNEIESIRGFWTSCSGQRDSDIDVFLTVLREDPAILRPHVLLVEQDGKPAALLAGRIVRRRLAFSVGYFKFFSPIANVMTFPYGSLRGDSSSESCEQLARAIASGLDAGDADLALIEYVGVDSNLYRWCQSVAGVFTRDHFAAQRYHRKRTLPTSIDGLNASLSAHERKRFRQIQRKLNNDFPGAVRVDRLLSAKDLDHRLRVIEEISKKTWQERLGTGLKVVGPLMKLFELQAQKSWLRIYTLYLADQPCAFWIGAVYQGTFYSDYVGFDPAYSQYSPGMYLLSQMMEEFCTEGVESIDFGFSDEEYKKRFGNVAWREASLHIFAPTLRGFALNVMRAIVFLLHEPARALLTRTNLIQRAKKIFRRTIKEKP